MTASTLCLLAKLQEAFATCRNFEDSHACTASAALLLNRWLLSRVGGATSLTYAYNDGTYEVVRDISDEQHKRQQQIIMHIIPEVSGVMPPDATIHLDLTWGESFKSNSCRS